MAVLKNVIKALDPAPDEKKELTLACNLLFELAEQRQDIQENLIMTNLRTAGTPDNPSIPITSILATHSETRAYVSADATTMVTTVTDAVKKFINGGSDNIVSGIGDLISGALTAILGAGTGIQSSMHSYYIVVEGMSIVRFDIRAWQRRIEAQGFTTQIENAMTMTAVKSSVNVDAITFNTFLQAYKLQLENMNFDKSQLKEFLQESKEVFELLRDPGSSSSPLLNAPAMQAANAVQAATVGRAANAGRAVTAGRAMTAGRVANAVQAANGEKMSMHSPSFVNIVSHDSPIRGKK